MSGKRVRVAKLEARRREWEAAHVPLSEVRSVLLAVLSIVREEAGQEVFEQVAGEIVGRKAQRVAALSEGWA